MASSTIVDWKNYLYEVIENWTINVHNTQLFGGPGIIVEIDESKFGKSKYNRGRQITSQWVFGMFERGSKRVKMIAMENRDKRTLVGIIKEHIKPGTTIHSDCWAAHQTLNEEGFVHKTVNHSEIFVNPDDGVHTQNVERLWKDVKSWILKSGIRKIRFEKYIASYVFCRAYKADERFHYLLKHMARMYKHLNSP